MPLKATFVGGRCDGEIWESELHEKLNRLVEQPLRYYSLRTEIPKATEEIKVEIYFLRRGYDGEYLYIHEGLIKAYEQNNPRPR